MRSTDYDDTIAAIEQEYSKGEYSDLDADPEAEARARSREEQEKLDRDRKRARGSRRLAEVAFTPAALPALRQDGRTLADVDRELEDARKDCNRHQWLHYGPLSMAIVAMRPERYRDIIDAWQARDMERYERLLRNRGLVR